MNNFQPMAAFMLIFIATVIRFCDEVYCDRVDFGVSHLKVGQVSHTLCASVTKQYKLVLA